MISWIIIGVVLLAGFLLIRMNHFRHKIFLIVFLFLLLFVYSTVTLVNKNNNFDLTSTEGFFTAVKVYLGWLGNGFQNLKVLTGNAVKMDWTSTNGTFTNKEINAKKI